MKSCRDVSRRVFLRQSLRSGAALSAGPAFVASSVLGQGRRDDANDRIRLGVIGVGVRGKYLIANLPDQAQVVALSDCYEPNARSALEPSGEFKRLLAKFARTDAAGCAFYQDYRRMIDREQLDAVMVATPDHQHVLAAILACQAGLDVYCEKPLSLTIAEGRALAVAVQRYGRILQVGSQQRSMEVNRIACEFVRSGGLGRISVVELANYPSAMQVPAGLEAEPIPDGLDWSLFCGPRTVLPYRRQLWLKDAYHVGDLLWRGWDLWDDFSGHLATNWGAHSIDMVQWSLNRDHSGPTMIRPVLDRLAENLDRPWLQKTPAMSGPPRPDNPDAMRFCPVIMTYDDGVELRWTTGEKHITFHGEHGKMMMTRNHFRTDPIDLLRMPTDRSVVQQWEGAGHVARPHVERWLDCLRSRSQPNAPVEVGHRSVTVCHLARIVRRLGRPLQWDPAIERFVGDDEANRHLDRTRRPEFELPT